MKCDETPLVVLLRPGAGETCDVLICAGHATSASAPDDIRLTELEGTLEIGRGVQTASGPRLATDDPCMSRVHARIRRVDAERVTVCDLGSRNGTFLQGRRLHEEEPLHDGAILAAGAHVFVYRLMRREDLASIRTGLARPFGPVPTLSPLMARLGGNLRRLAASCVEILLTGESGAGKEVMAEAIHRESGRRGAFIAIDCAALPDALVESELFGYARGAHSTATLNKPGLVELAQGGTLYLDEIGEMSSHAQAKLLRFLQDGSFHSLGETRPRHLDVRIVAATRSAVAVACNGLGLRLDLAARLGPKPILIPPLRERPEDIGLLLCHFLRDQPCPFDLPTYRALFLNPWPGNVRELEKTVRTAKVLSTGAGSVGLDALPTAPAAREQPSEPSETDDCCKRSSAHAARPTEADLEELLRRHRGNVGQIAREIGRQRTLVWRWLRSAGLEPAQHREPIGNGSPSNA
jgi:DNA-binding NtrC family response regulator